MYSEYKKSLQSEKDKQIPFQDFLHHLFGSVTSLKGSNPNLAEPEVLPLGSETIMGERLSAMEESARVASEDAWNSPRGERSEKHSYMSFIVLSDDDEVLDTCQDENRDEIHKKSPPRSISSSESALSIEKLSEITQDLSSLELHGCSIGEYFTLAREQERGVDEETCSDINFYLSDSLDEDVEDDEANLSFIAVNDARSDIHQEKLNRPRYRDNLTFYRNFSAVARPKLKDTVEHVAGSGTSQANKLAGGGGIRVTRRLTRSVPVNKKNVSFLKLLQPFSKAHRSSEPEDQKKQPWSKSNSSCTSGGKKTVMHAKKAKKQTKEISKVDKETFAKSNSQILEPVADDVVRRGNGNANPSMSLFLDSANDLKSAAEEEFLQNLCSSKQGSKSCTLALIYHHPILYNF